MKFLTKKWSTYFRTRQNILLIFLILSITSSCKKENNYENDSELCVLLSKMHEDDQKIRKSTELKNGTKKVKDSLWNVQNQLDKKNTAELIEIIKKRGWISKKKLGCTEYISPMLIFRHAPQQYWNEIKPLIDKELAEKRISEMDHWFIDDHLKGRPGIIKINN